MIKATMKNVASLSFMMLLMMSFGVTAVAQNTLLGDNIVINGDFSGDSLGPWAGDGAATFAATNGEASITGIPGTGDSWAIQMWQILNDDQIGELAKGGNWELSFDARTTADSTKTFHVFLGNNQAGGDWNRYWWDEYSFTTDTSMVLTTNTELTWAEMKLAFEVNHDAQDIFFDNIVLRRVEDNILYDGEIVIGEDSLSAAWTQLTAPATATFSVDDGAVMISDIANVVNSWDVQFAQILDSVQVDSIFAGPYEMFFDARTSVASKTIQVFFGNNGTDTGAGADWTNWAPTVELNDTMKTYSLIVDATQNWTQMKIGFEVSADDSPVWFDNVIVRRVRDVPPAAPDVALSAEGGVVSITVSAVEEAATYDIYFSDSEFADPDGGTLIGTLDASGSLVFEHSTLVPHPNFVTDITAYYGVVAKKDNGTASAMTSESVETSTGVRPQMIVQLEEDDANAILTAVSNEEMPTSEMMASYFPDGYSPFEINESNRFQSEGGGVDNDADLSGKFWIGYETYGDGSPDYLIIYAETTDDMLSFAPSTGDVPGGAAWNYDTWEIGIGAYEPASFINGSDHQDFEIGEEPDYQFRGGFFDDGTLFFHANNGSAGDLNSDDILGSITIGDETDTGFRTLTLVNTISLSAVETTNADFVYPTGEEVTVVPLNIAMNDNDGDSRDNQLSWAPNSGTNSWWNTPAQWATVAMVGTDAFVVVSNEEEDSNPITFSLEQNYPNPFNPSTNIEFTLGTSSDVTLEVYNMLGQRVATLMSAEKLSAGTHRQQFDATSLASGMYLYRLTTDSFTQTRKMMLIK